MSATILPIVKEVVLQASPSRVWRAITDKEEMKQWYFDLADFQAVPGFEFQFYGENEGRKYLHLCKVIEVEEHKKLTYSWSYEGYAGESFVTFELFEAPNGTRLKLTHTGLETFAGQHKDFDPANFNEGWNYLIGTSIKEYLEKQNDTVTA